MRKSNINIMLLIFIAITIKTKSSFAPLKGDESSGSFSKKEDLNREKSEFKSINISETESLILNTEEKLSQDKNIVKETIEKEAETKKLIEIKKEPKTKVKNEKNKQKQQQISDAITKEDISANKIIEKNKPSEKQGFYDKRISYFNEALTGTKYTNDSLSGKFKSDVYMNNGIELSAKKNNSQYTGFIIKRLEGEYYSSETIRDEFQIGGRFTQYYPGQGLFFLGSKYYQGESSGYYLDNGDYIDRDKLKDNKIRGEIGGYYEKNGYFIGGVIGQDFAGNGNKIYEDGNFKSLEVGPRIPRKSGDFLIPSIEYNSEDYETYKFDEVWMKVAYERHHEKGYIIPYISLLAFRKHQADGANGDFDSKFPDRYRVGVRGLQKLNESWDVNYGVYWQNESRDYKSGAASWDSIFTYINISYKFDN